MSTDGSGEGGSLTRGRESPILREGIEPVVTEPPAGAAGAAAAPGGAAPAGTRWPHLPAVPLAILSALAAALVWGSTTYGAGISPDSVSYISVADRLLEGRGFTRFNGNPYVHWPPLYPMVLAGLGALGIPVIVGARLLNAAVMALIVWVGGWWTWRRTGSAVGAVIVAGMLLLSRPLNEVVVFIWTEPLFILLVLLSLTRLEAFLSDHATPDLLWSAGFAAGAAATRYVGVSLILVGAALILLGRGQDPRERVLRSAIFGAIASAPIGAWMLRNLLNYGALTGSRPDAATGVPGHVGDAVQEVGTWFLPGFLALRWPGVLFGAIALAAPLILLFMWRLGGPGSRREAAARPAWTMAWFAVVFTAFLIWAASTAGVDSIKVRLMAPAFVPLLLAWAVTLYALRDLATRWPGRAGRYGLYLFLAAWLALAASRVLPQLDDRDVDRGFASAEWRESELLDFMETTSLAGPIYTNVPDGVYIHTGEVYRLAPRKTINAQTEDVPPDLLRFTEAVATEGPVHLVWFESGRTSYLYTGEELGERFEVELVRRTADGAVYRIGRQGSGP